jgi:hypothetical protein
MVSHRTLKAFRARTVEVKSHRPPPYGVKVVKAGGQSVISTEKEVALLLGPAVASRLLHCSIEHLAIDD